MSTLRHDSIVAAIIALLQAAPALDSIAIGDDPSFEEQGQGADAAIRVTLMDSLPQNRAYGVVTWSSTVRVACMARDDRPDATLGRLSSQLAAAAYAALMADQTLGGLAKGIDEPRLQPDLTYLGTRVGVLYLDFPVKHETQNRVLT